MLTGIKGGKQDVSLMCACHKVIPIENAGTCKRPIGLDNVSCKQSIKSFNRNDFNRNDKKVRM